MQKYYLFPYDLWKKRHNDKFVSFKTEEPMFSGSLLLFVLVKF